MEQVNERTVMERIASVVRKTPNSPALMFVHAGDTKDTQLRTTTWSYSQVWAAASRAADSMQALIQVSMQAPVQGQSSAMPPVAASAAPPQTPAQSSVAAGVGGLDAVSSPPPLLVPLPASVGEKAFEASTRVCVLLEQGPLLPALELAILLAVMPCASHMHTSFAFSCSPLPEHFLGVFACLL